MIQHKYFNIKIYSFLFFNKSQLKYTAQKNRSYAKNSTYHVDTVVFRKEENYTVTISERQFHRKESVIAYCNTCKKNGGDTYGLFLKKICP